MFTEYLSIKIKAVILQLLCCYSCGNGPLTFGAMPYVKNEGNVPPTHLSNSVVKLCCVKFGPLLQNCIHAHIYNKGLSGTRVLGDQRTKLLSEAFWQNVIFWLEGLAKENCERKKVNSFSAMNFNTLIQLTILKHFYVNMYLFTCPQGKF